MSLILDLFGVGLSDLGSFWIGGWSNPVDPADWPKRHLRNPGFGSLFQKTREGRGCPKAPCWKGFPANFNAAGKFFPDFPAARHALPAKVWSLSSKEMARERS